ncbi:glycosyltransferase [Formosa sediminum]|uniref:Glycosyltransferase n=1 Tax=Formosa sediminum TaxID=2594004 RepID=A0A516GPS2_9FLAO|nr:glycosyltransferase [Formosa sediminum]QDO93534.1 glycosyltransferase [Formosa sediminum]
MKLSIIIPVYNAENFVGQCLESILNQNIDPSEFEIIAVDDGSIDGSVSVLQTYEKNNDNILVVLQKNQGVGAARNKGMELAKGKYLYFLDSDDYLASNVLLPILEYAQTNNLQIVTFQSITTKKRNLYTSSLAGKHTTKVQSGPNYIGAIGYRNEVWWYIVERNFVKELGLKFILGRWMEDAIFTTQLFLAAQRMSKLQIDAHRYVTVKNSVMTNKKPEHYIKVICDLSHAAEVFNDFIYRVKETETGHKHDLCKKRLEERQQSLVFFMMIRMLKSRISFKEVKTIINHLNIIGAYPLTNFGRVENRELSYGVLKHLFNIKCLYYKIFICCNPILKHIYK